jgi:hypothetical protein
VTPRPRHRQPLPAPGRHSRRRHQVHRQALRDSRRAAGPGAAARARERRRRRVRGALRVPPQARLCPVPLLRPRRGLHRAFRTGRRPDPAAAGHLPGVHYRERDHLPGVPAPGAGRRHLRQRLRRRAVLPASLASRPRPRVLGRHRHPRPRHPQPGAPPLPPCPVHPDGRGHPARPPPQWGSEPDPTSAALNHLTAAEQSVYHSLRSGRLGERLRLEQELISFASVTAAAR